MTDDSRAVTSVTTSRERALAGGQWLLAAAPDRKLARVDWAEKGAAWLRPGALFATLVVPAPVVHAAVGLSSPEECAGPLAEVLESGPLFFDPAGFGTDGAYTALLPVSVRRLRIPPGLVLPPARALLRVPAPGVRERVDGGPWWVVPLDGPGLLCPFDRVAVLAQLGRDRLRAERGEGGE